MIIMEDSGGDCIYHYQHHGKCIRDSFNAREHFSVRTYFKSVGFC